MSDEKESLLLVVACEKRKNVLVAGFQFLGGGGRKGVNRIQISNGVFGKAVAKTKLTKQF